MRENKTFAVILIISLFFLWGLVHNLNPILIPHLKKTCRLTDLQSAFIDAAFFIGYFTMAIPAGLLIKRYGYKKGILFGLFLFAVGALLFIPAASTRVYGFFLLALFVIASGLTFLETAANPYMVKLGDEKSASFRLNLAQSFNGLAATLAPLIGGLFILSGTVLSEGEMKQLSAEQTSTYLDGEAASLKLPYLIISLVVFLVGIIIWRSPLPEIKDIQKKAAGAAGRIWNQKNLLVGVVAQFFYVGAQVGVSGFFIRFLNKTAGIGEKSAAFYLSLALFFFMIGRFVGTLLLKFIRPERVLLFYSLMNILLLLLAVRVNGMMAVYALIGVQFFMSIMFPTIFSLSIRGLGPHTELGSSMVIMSIVGGAVFPLVMGKISDLTSIQLAYLVPAACFLVVLFFSIQSGRERRVASTIAKRAQVYLVRDSNNIL